MRYSDGIITVVCNHCNTQSSHQVDSIDMTYVEEFGQWENVMLLCPLCEAFGRKSYTVINMNIPIICEMEPEVMEEDSELTTEEEREERRQVRDLIWDVRPDLVELNRKQVVNDFLSRG